MHEARNHRNRNHLDLVDKGIAYMEDYELTINIDKLIDFENGELYDML